MNHHSVIAEARPVAHRDDGTDAAAGLTRRSRLTRRTVVGAALALALVVSTVTATPAYADDAAAHGAGPASGLDAASVETLLRGVGVVSDAPSSAVADTSRLRAMAGTTADDAAPRVAPAGTATVSTGSGLSIQTGANQLKMRPVASGAASRSPGGLAVYGNGQESAFALSTARTGGNAGYSVITGANAPTRYDYVLTVDGRPATLATTADGGVDVRDAAGTVVNSIAPAWAVDARGASLVSSYSVAGNVLTQHVEHEGAAYPVVADPRFRCDGLWCTVELTRHETRLMAAGALSPGIACRFLGPGAGACAALLIAGWAQANIAVNSGQCIGFRVWQRNLISYLHLAYVRCYA
jgi:hypothetical protein